MYSIHATRCRSAAACSTLANSRRLPRIPRATTSVMAEANGAPPVSNEPVLLYNWACPYVHRVALALAHKKAKIPEIEVDLRNKPAWLTKYSPLGKVPAVTYLHGGEQQVLYESLPLVYWVDEYFEGPALLPADPALRCKGRIMVQRFSEACIPVWYKMLFAQDQSQFDALLSAAKTELKWLEDNMQGQGPFLVGPQPTLVDAAIGPWLLRMFLFKHTRNTDMLADFPKLKAWEEAYKALPEVQSTMRSQGDKGWEEANVEAYHQYAEEQRKKMAEAAAAAKQ